MFFRWIDDLLIDRVFQPAVNAAQAHNPRSLSALFYGAYLGAIVAGAMMAFMRGTLMEHVIPTGLQAAVALFLYGQTLRGAGFVISAPNPLRGPLVMLMARMMTLTLLMGPVALIVTLPQSQDLKQIVGDLGWLAYVCGVYFDVCDPAKPKPCPKEAPGTVFQAG